MERKVFIGTPVVSGAPQINYVISLYATAVIEFPALGWPAPRLYFRVGDSDLCRARNAIIWHFLESDCTDLVLIDSDISWAPGILPRLINHDKDFVGGAYRGRSDDRDIYFLLWPQQKEMWTDTATGYPLLKVDGMSIGFCRLTRSCVEKMIESLNGRYIIDPLFPGEKIPWLIDFDRHDNVRYEEGYSLCRRWRDLGGDVWVDPTINLGHMGPKIFESDLVGFLAKMQGIVRFNEPNDVQARIEEAWLRGVPKVAAE